MSKLSSVLVLWCVLLLLLTGGMGAQAQTSTAQSPSGPVAVVSFNALVFETNEAQRDMGALQAKYAPRQSQLESLNKEIETERKNLSDVGDKLNDQERERRVQTLGAKQKQFDREADDFRNDSQTDAQQVYQRVAQKVFAFVQEYAHDHGYAAVIDRGTDAAPVVWYTAENIDVTEAMVKAYNSKSGVTPPDAGAKPPSAVPTKPKPSKPAAKPE